MRAKENGVETYYAADGSGVIAEFQTLTSSSWQWKKNYVKWGDRLVATETADGLQYQHPDRLGTKLITNASGGMISEQATLPFGTALPTTSIISNGGVQGEAYQSTSQPNPHQRRFTSYERSTTTNLDYAVNRHYAAEQGRFTQVDPIGMAAVSLENPQTLNLYAYCANDPVNHTDASGLLPKWLKKLFKIVMFVISVVAAVTAVLAAINGIMALAAAAEKAGWWAAIKQTGFKGMMKLVNQIGKAVASVAKIFKKTIPYLDFINSVTDMISTEKKDLKKFWKWFKFVSGTASQIAEWVGSKRASAVLAFTEIIETIKDITILLKDKNFKVDVGQLFKEKKFDKIRKNGLTFKYTFEGLGGVFNKHVAIVLLAMEEYVFEQLGLGNGFHKLVSYFMWGVVGYDLVESVIKKADGVGKAFRSAVGAVAAIGTGITSSEMESSDGYASSDRRFGNLQSGPFLDFARGGVR